MRIKGKQISVKPDIEYNALKALSAKLEELHLNKNLMKILIAKLPKAFFPADKKEKDMDGNIFPISIKNENLQENMEEEMPTILTSNIFEEKNELGMINEGDEEEAESMEIINSNEVSLDILNLLNISPKLAKFS